MKATAAQQLNTVNIETDKRTVCTTVAVSGGYPGDYEKGKEITGIDKVNPEDSILFHMGTTGKDGKTVTNGGRVFCISAYGRSVFDAAEISRMEMLKVNFEGKKYRMDIGYEFE